MTATTVKPTIDSDTMSSIAKFFSQPTPLPIFTISNISAIRLMMRKLAMMLVLHGSSKALCLIELPLSEQVRIVENFVLNNFVQHDLCAIVAIHEGKNADDPMRNNPHAHVIVPTRTVGSDGFSKKKDREHDKRKYIGIWREQWALVQNRAYERNHRKP